MDTYISAGKAIRLEQYVPSGSGPHPALLLLHGSGGAVTYWLDRFAPVLTKFGVGLYAPHYFDRTGTVRATAETILDGQHFPSWLSTVQDAVSHLRARRGVDAARVGVLGISLGGYLAMALAVSDPRLRLVIELSGGMPPGLEDRMTEATPPTLVLHGEADTVVPVSEARKLQRLLVEKRVRHQVEIFPNENHWFSSKSSGMLLMTCGAFLMQHL